MKISPVKGTIVSGEDRIGFTIDNVTSMGKRLEPDSPD